MYKHHLGRNIWGQMDTLFDYLASFLNHAFCYFCLSGQISSLRVAKYAGTLCLSLTQPVIVTISYMQRN